MPWQSQNHTIIRNHTIMVKAIYVTIIITFIFNINLSYAFSNRTPFDTRSHAQRHIRTEAEENLLDIKDNPAAITIPSTYGLIIESHKGKGSALVVHIQDCHVNEVAQLNIARMLKTLLKNYDIRLLCLEGASKRLDTSFYDTFPDGETKEKVSSFFVKKALFTGAEYFKITNRDQDISAFGVEDKDLYLAHLKAYQDVQPDKSKIISYLTGLETALNRIKERIYPKPLKELEAKDREYQDKIITLAEYASYINRSTKRLKTDLKPYPNFRIFIRLIKKERGIDFKKAEEQRQKLIEELGRRLSKKQLERLLELGLDYRLGEISTVDFYTHLRDLIKTAEYRLKAQDFKELLLYIEYLELSSKVNNPKLFDEMESLSERIASSLFKSQIDKTVFRYSKSLAALKDLYNLRLTHKALGYMDDNPAEFDIGRITIFIKRTSTALAIPANFDYRGAYLNARELESARQFYQIATERDITIVNNTLKKLPYSSNKTAVLVTGGFHTSGITNILKQKQVSYVVICPIIGMENYQRLYADRMKGIIPDYADILQVASQMLVPALATGGITDGLKIKTAFSIAFAGILQSDGLRRILDSNEQGLTLPAIVDDRPLRLEEAVLMIRAAIDAKGSVETDAPLKIASLPATGLPEQPVIEAGAKAASAGEKPKEPFSLKKMVGTAVVTATIGGLTHFGVVVVDKDLASDTKHGMVIVKDDPSDTRTPKSSSKVPKMPEPVRPLKESKIAANVMPRKIDRSSGTLKEASAIEFTLQQTPQAPGVPQHARIKVASVKPQQLPVTPSARPRQPLAAPGAVASGSQERLIVSRAAPASIFQPGQGFVVHPAVFIAEEGFFSEEQVKKEQIKNYKAAYERVPRIVELVFGDKISEEQKRCWRLLLLGTEVTESNFLDRYSKVMPSGNGRYQVTGSTAYGIIHSYVTYPIRIKTKSGKVIYRTGIRKELIPLFAKATDNKVTWDAVKNMSKPQLRKLLAADDNFSCLMSLLVYKEVLEREGIKAINSDPKVLAMLWKQYYNTIHGKGTVESFMERFGLIHKIPSESLEILYRKTKTEYKRLFFERNLGADCPEEEARKRYSQFKEERGLDKDFSRRVVTLLRDEYGITPSNIYSKITPFESMFDNKIRYARFKDAEFVHIIIYRKQGKLSARLVVCRDISQWAKENEKAMADITLHHENELYTVLTNPFQKKTEVQATERIRQDTGFTAERIPTLSMQKTIEAATVKPAVSPTIIKLYADRLAAGAKLSSPGGLKLTGERHPEGINTLLKDKRRYEEILHQA